MIWGDLRQGEKSSQVLISVLLGLGFFFSYHSLATPILLPHFGFLLFFLMFYDWLPVIAFVLAYFLSTLFTIELMSLDFFQACVLLGQGIFLSIIQVALKREPSAPNRCLMLLGSIIFSWLIGLLIGVLISDFSGSVLYQLFLKILITQCFFFVIMISGMPRLSTSNAVASLVLIFVIFLTLLHINWMGLAFLCVFLVNYFFGGLITSVVFVLSYAFFSNYSLSISNDYLEIVACISFFTVIINLLHEKEFFRVNGMKANGFQGEPARLIQELEEYKQLASIINYSETVAFLWRADRDRAVEFVSDNAWRIGYSPASFKMSHESFNRAIFSDDRERVLARIDDILQNGQGQSFELEYRLLTESGQIIWVIERSLLKKGEQNKFDYIQGTLMDITMNKEAEKRLHRLTYFDELTGLSNRVAFIHELQEQIDLVNLGEVFALLQVDIDKFKHINDSFGHQCGDEIICTLAKRFNQLAESEGLFVARLANNNFSFLMSHYEKVDNVEILAQKLLKVVSEPFPIHDRYYPLTARIGISLFPQDGRDVNELISNADVATNQAKEYGKNHFLFYNKSMRSRSLQDMRLGSDLAIAYQQEQFVLFYQPKINLHTARPAGAEVLLRWQHPERGLLSPDEFVSLAEDTGLIIEIGAWVMKKACQQLRVWEEDGLKDMRLSVNLSPRQFWDASLLDFIRDLLVETHVNPHALELELTESMVMRDPEQYRIVMKKLRDIGVRIAVDDFGVGHSSLNQIKRFPINTIKIDKSFISDLAYNEEGRLITKAIIALGHSLNLTVVAEGIENQSQEAFLKAAQCDEVQGYFYSKPLRASEFYDWYKEFNCFD